MYSFLKAFLVSMKLLSLSQFYAPKCTKIGFCSERHLVSLRPMGVVGLTTNHKPTLPSHKSLMGINF